ncbi:MAG TPA: hypothetical protein ENG66_05330 [Thermococcus sp.]|nr:hypothetical protein [Thermococcus sp.]
MSENVCERMRKFLDDIRKALRISEEKNIEVGFAICETKDGEWIRGEMFEAGLPEITEEQRKLMIKMFGKVIYPPVVMKIKCPEGTRLVGAFHTHPGGKKSFGRLTFSSQDMWSLVDGMLERLGADFACVGYMTKRNKFSVDCLEHDRLSKHLDTLMEISKAEEEVDLYRDAKPFTPEFEKLSEAVVNSILKREEIIKKAGCRFEERL